MENQMMRMSQRAKGPATILAIGTASPANCVYQADMPDFYFRVTNSDNMTELKDKFKRICTFLYIPLIKYKPLCMHACKFMC